MFDKLKANKCDCCVLVSDSGVAKVVELGIGESRRSLNQSIPRCPLWFANCSANLVQGS